MKITYRDGMTEGKEEIEIPTLVTSEDLQGEYNKVSNEEDFGLLVDAMGFDSVAEFEEKTGVGAEELIGKSFMLHGWAGMNKIFIKEEDQ